MGEFLNVIAVFNVYQKKESPYSVCVVAQRISDLVLEFVRHFKHTLSPLLTVSTKNAKLKFLSKLRDHFSVLNPVVWSGSPY